jgi:hypothetical protein
MPRVWRSILFVRQRISDASVLQWLLALPISGIISYWAWITQWGYLPVVLTSIIVFAVVIWIFNGIIYMQRQRRPSKARIIFDYAYAIPVTDIQFGLDLQNKANTLEIRPRIKNVAPGPVKYRAARLLVTFNDRFVEWGCNDSILSREIERTIIPNKGFDAAAYESFGPETQGKLEFEILYGHPNDEFARRTSKKFDLIFFKRADGFVLHWYDRGDADEAI